MSNLQKKVEELESRVGELEEELNALKSGASTQNLVGTDAAVAEINLPADMIDKIMALDEPKQIPILWNFSTKPIMTVKEFMEASARKGFTLSHSWLPSVGGHFSSTFIKKDGIFYEVKIKGKGNEKSWKLTDGGKFKIAKMINELKAK